MPEDDRPTITVTLDLSFAYECSDELAYAANHIADNDTRETLMKLRKIIQDVYMSSNSVDF